MIKQSLSLSALLFYVFFPDILHAAEKVKTNKVTAFKLPITSSWALTSNYIFRGITQTNNTGAVQGGITWNFLSSGIYASLWGSNVKFPEDEVSRTSATLEFDTAVGITNTIKENFTYNLSLVRYNYPQSAYYDYNEIIANFQYYFITALLGYSNDVYATGENGTYYNFGINYNIPEKYALGLTGVNFVAAAGHYILPADTTLYTSYSDYTIQIAKIIGNYQLSVAWTDTNGKFYGPASWGDNKVVFTINANFS